MSRFLQLFATTCAFRACPFGLVLTLAVCLPQVAAGAERSRMVVVPFVARDGVSDASATKFTTLVTEELKARTDTVDFVALPSAGKAAAGEGPRPRKTPSPEAVGALESGKRAFDDLRFEDAVRDLRRGIDGMLADPATADFASINDAQVKLAAASFRMGEEKEAKATLADLTRLNPSVVLPPGFPPVFQRELEKAKKKLEKQAKGQLSIEGPSGATAYLNGRDLGLVPVLEENVGAGMHYVRVENSRGERWGQVVEVKTGVTKVRAAFANSTSERSPINAATDPRVGTPVDDAMLSRLQAFTKAAGADFALFGVVSRVSDTQLQAGGALYSVKRGAVSLLGPATFDTDVLTANTEVFKFCDEAIRRAISFGTPTALPLDLAMKRSAVATTKPTDKPDRPDSDVEVVAPTRKPSLTPRTSGGRPVATGSGASALTEPPVEAKEQPAVKSGVPVWVWVVTGVVVAGGAAAGGYFLVTNVTKPVTGTVNATW